MSANVRAKFEYIHFMTKKSQTFKRKKLSTIMNEGLANSF
jgi:hypothetical protein